MSSRFEAEEILRAAASGAFPAEGHVLLRDADGWKFSPVEELEVQVSLDQIDEPIDDRGLLPSAIAYEDEDNTFVGTNAFVGVTSVPVDTVTDHEAALAIAFAQLTGLIADAQVPESAVVQYADEFPLSRSLLLMGG
ncbi:hypothetical protein LCGC14_1653000 [marine sediment metagenome]|uniref:Uncharacterized protein n=1 Tax=marine sediment metagenome TaxID=412755 RepID=A0A0F9IIU4_9ZZZZ